ncbi:formimidoylglutamase [Flavobacterium rhizosphaerae]|uniref:Formimidoylglutamase n=1 Tax=Flavobacterium rhizosphaerae TaxID=3163298 RepID=A0ABW8YWS0_9FLAO
MAFEFLKPLDASFLEYAGGLSVQSLAAKAVFHNESGVPDIDGAGIAIIGVLDNRGQGEKKQGIHLNYIRREFYSLYPGNWNKKIIDLGNITAGETLTDTYYAIKEIVAELIKNKIIPIIIGGSHDMAYGVYRAYDRLEQMVNYVSIDSRFDLGSENEPLSSRSYLTRIIVDEPNNLFNYSNIGFQTYYNSQEEIDLLDKLYFDAYRLGEVCRNISVAEPVLRDADFVSVDMTSVKSGDSGNIVKFNPNGFDGKEICTLARYAGISDKVTSFGIFNHADTKQESVLISQVLWYFIEGVHYRSDEYPFVSRENYIKFIVPMEEGDVVFFKSDKTDRWWIELPIIQGTDNKIMRSTLLPCSYEDYLNACDNEYPEKLWKAQRKHII